MKYLVYKIVCRWICKYCVKCFLWIRLWFWLLINNSNNHCMHHAAILWCQISHLSEILKMCKCVIFVLNILCLISSNHEYLEWLLPRNIVQQSTLFYEGHLVQTIIWKCRCLYRNMKQKCFYAHILRIWTIFIYSFKHL